MPVTVPPQYLGWIEQAAQQSGIPPQILAAQEQVESGFNPRAVSPAGAIGIAQFLPSTAAELGINPWDPQSSIFGQARYLAQLRSRFGGDLTKALEAYNAGPSGDLRAAAGYAAEIQTLAQGLAAQFSGGQFTVAGSGPSGSGGRCTSTGWVDQPCGPLDPGCALGNWWGALSCAVSGQLHRLGAGLEVILGLALLAGGGLVLIGLTLPRTELGQTGLKLARTVAEVAA